MTTTPLPQGPDDPKGGAGEDARRMRVLWGMSALAVGLLLVSLVVTILLRWDEYNPFWERTPEFREAHGLAITLYKRPLTDDEFGRVLEMCESGHFQARVVAMSAVNESVKRAPERAAPAAEVMTRVVRSRNVMLREAAERVLRQIEGR